MGITAWAEVIQERLFEVHRGAFSVDDFTVIFGNDGYGKRVRIDGESGDNKAFDGTGDPRSRRQVERLRETLAASGVEEMDFGTSLDGYTWAMLVRGKHADAMMDAVWEAYAGRIVSASDSDDGFLAYQKDVALRALSFPFLAWGPR
jgi:hypothetical protein